MHVGFTGTRERLTPAQARALGGVLAGYPAATLHHGDCIGADALAHAIAICHGGWRIEVHPGDGSPRVRAFTVGYDLIHPPKPYLKRNADIVAAADELLACPSGPEIQRSGTWSTVRKARRKGIPRVIVWPNGSVTREPPEQSAAGHPDELSAMPAREQAEGDAERTP